MVISIFIVKKFNVKFIFFYLIILRENFKKFFFFIKLFVNLNSFGLNFKNYFE
jgi:hypothetical protein